MKILYVIWFLFYSILAFSQDYEKELIKYQRIKQKEFKKNKSRCVATSDYNYFDKLYFFEINENLNFKAKYNALNPTDFWLKLNNNDSVLHEIVGKVSFSYKGNMYELYVFGLKSRNTKELLIPFKDKSNGSETYSEGRYMNIGYLEDKEVFDFDFNKCHQPTSYYNQLNLCPLVPETNILDFSIEAGERIKK